MALLRRTPFTPLLVVASALVAACTCGELARPSPAPESVTPRGGESSGPVAIVIHGANFLPEVQQHLGSEAPVQVDERFRALLGGTELLDVRRIDDVTLEATVPPGMAPGSLDLDVIGPSGTSGRLPAAYQVTDRAAPTLEVRAESAAEASEGQLVAIPLRVTNGGGRDLVDVTLLRVTSSSGSVTAGRERPPPLGVAAGASKELSVTVLALSAGSAEIAIELSGVDAVTGALLSARAATVLKVVRPAQLEATVSATPARLNVGQEATVTLELTNRGEAPATGFAVRLEAQGLTVVDPPPALAALAGGAKVSVPLRVTTASAGQGLLRIVATAVDGNSGARLQAEGTAGITVVQAAGLTVTPTLVPIRASLGQVVTLSVALVNGGGAPLQGIALTVTPSAAGLVTVGPMPAPISLAGGQAATLTLTLDALAPGSLTLALTARGTDGNTGATVTGTASAGPLTLEAPAALSATVSFSPLKLDVGQPGALQISVSNAGGATARGVTLALSSTTPALALPSVLPAPFDLAGGVSLTLPVMVVGAASGQALVTADLKGTDANSQAPLATPLASTQAIKVERPATLAATAVCTPARASLGQQVRCTVAVANSGEGAVDLVSLASVTQTGAGALLFGALPSSAALAGGASLTLTATATAQGAGPTTPTFHGAATNRNTGAALSFSAQAGAVRLDQPAALTGRLTASLAKVTVDQPFDLDLQVSNGGDADALQVTPSAVVISGAGGVTLVSTPTAADVPARSSKTFRWRYQSVGTGPVSFSVGGAGFDQNSGAPAGFPDVSAGPVLIESPSTLSGVSSLSATRVTVGSTFTLTLAVTNQGQAIARSVTGSAPVVQGTGTVALLSSPAAVDITAGATANLTFTLKATGAGSATLVSEAAGTDGNSGAAVFTGKSQAPPMSLQGGPSLSAALVLPAKVSDGQPFQGQLAVNNAGDARAINVAPQAATSSGAGAVSAGTPPAAATVPGQGSFTFLLPFTAVSAGSVQLSVGGGGADENSLAPATFPPAAATVLVQRRAQAAATLAVPATVSVGQAFTAALQITNPGEAVLAGFLPAAPLSSGPAVTLGSAPAAKDVAGGTSSSFDRTLTANAPGTLSLTLGGSGADGNSGASVSASASGTVQVQAPAALSGALSLTPAQVSLGQTFSAVLQVTNGGQAAAIGVLPGPVTFGGSGTASVVAAPGARTIAAGATTSFSYSLRADTAGTLTVALSAAGVDGNDGRTISTGLIGPLPVTLQRGAALLGAISLAPARVSVGQTFGVDLQVTNSGEAAATAFTPDPPTLSAPAVASLVASPAAASVAGASSSTFRWVYRANASGSTTFTLSGAGTDGNSGAPVTLAPVTSLLLVAQRPAALRVQSLTAAPAVLNVGQSIGVTMVVVNDGEAGASAVSPSGTAASSGRATLSAGPSPASASIAGGATATFNYSFAAASSGAVAFSGAASGKDANSGAAISAASTTSAGVTVQNPAQLTAVLSAPAVVNIGQGFTTTATVTNPGDASATVVSATLALGAPGTAGTASPSSVTLAGGAQQAFIASASGSSRGPLTLLWSASGTDATDGRALTVSASRPVTVNSPAALGATLSLPGQLALASPFTVTMQVANPGDSTANVVTPTALTSSGTATLALVSGPTPASSTVAGGAAATFTWSYQATSAGTAILGGRANGIDAIDGGARASAAVTSNIAQVAEAIVIASNPFNDGTPFSFLFPYRGRLYLGPSKNNAGMVSMAPDGTGRQDVTLAFPADVTGSTRSANTAALTFPTLGLPGCGTNTLACGPDNENAGRGLFFSGTIAGTDWIAAASATTGNTNYVYMSNDTGAAQLKFRYVDLHSVLGGATRGPSAGRVFRDRTYLGFTDSGGSRPYLVVVNVAPPSPGLDPLAGDVVNLTATSMPGVGGIASPGMIDALFDFNDRIYLANSGGWMRSTTNAPRPYLNFPGDWATCTPTASATRTSLTTTKSALLEPADRAVPAFAAFNGRLYAARNTTLGPQLWACTPATTGDAAGCDPGDWSLVAPNTTGDTLLTQFNDANNAAITLLVATAGYLYLGFNNASTGAVVFRTAVTPTARADFLGQAGCSAALHPASCQGLGGNGFGSASNRRIFDAAALGFGGAPYVYLATGDSAVPVSVIKLAE